MQAFLGIVLYLLCGWNFLQSFTFFLFFPHLSVSFKSPHHHHSHYRHHSNHILIRNHCAHHKEEGKDHLLNAYYMTGTSLSAIDISFIPYNNSSGVQEPAYIFLWGQILYTFPNTIVSDNTVESWIWAWWKYLYHGNW